MPRYDELMNMIAEYGRVCEDIGYYTGGESDDAILEIAMERRGKLFVELAETIRQIV